MKLTLIKIILFITFSLAVWSCGKDKSEISADSEALVTVGDSTLTSRQVLEKIPFGLTAEDSIAMFRQIVDEWVRELVLTDFATKNLPDMERIDRLVNEYRNNLIITSYLQSMTEVAAADISENKVKQYYEANKNNMVLEEPIVKGAFLKVSEADPQADNLRKWMSDFTDRSIDKIEEAGLKHASTYKYFKDQWQFWSEITQQIPYRFFDADAFVRSTVNFETTDAGSIYLLHISDYILSGSEMPYELARIKIREILAAQELSKRKEKLITDIYKQQIKEGSLIPHAYDPIRHQMVE